MTTTGTTNYYTTYIDTGTSASTGDWGTSYIRSYGGAYDYQPIGYFTPIRARPSDTGDALERLRGMRERRAAGVDFAA